MRKRWLVRLTFVSAMVIGLVVATETDAFASDIARQSHFPSSGYHTFTEQSPTWAYSDGNGHGSDQITFSTGVDAWKYNVAPSLYDLATGDAIVSRWLYCGTNSVDRFVSSNKTAGYGYHSSVQHINNVCSYLAEFLIQFPISGGHVYLEVDTYFDLPSTSDIKILSSTSTVTFGP